MFEIGRWGAGKEKTFRARQAGATKWDTINGIQRVLYRLPETLAAIINGQTIWITEGEKDCERLVSVGLHATTNPFGAGKWRDEYSASLQGAMRLAILADNNSVGRKHAQLVAQSLHDFGLSCVRVLDLPGLDDDEDVSNWLDRGGSAERLEQLAEDTPEWHPDHAPAERPQILVRNELSEVIEEAQRALLLNPENGIYVRGGELVHIVREGCKPPKWLSRAPGSPVISLVTEHYLREQLDRAATWLKPNGTDRALPPLWVPRTLQARRQWSLPYLDCVIEAPSIRPDGSIIDLPGYDAATGVFFDPGDATFPVIPMSPTKDDARRALETLWEPFSDFPFVSEADRSAQTAHVLTLLARPAITGPCPMFPYGAHAPGEGKGLLAASTVLIGTGRPPALMPPPHSDEEMRKRILAIAIDGMSSVIVDNVRGVFGSESIAAALTADCWSDRYLGASRLVKAPLRTVWALTGNNVVFRGDLPRRVVPCDLDAGMENPEDRPQEAFRHPDLMSYLAERRPVLITAGLTILRAYFVAGCPRHGLPRMGSYEAWDDLVRGALIWCGAADPLESRSRIRDSADTELDALRDALRAWQCAFDREAVTCAEAVKRSRTSEELQVALVSWVGCGAEKLDATRLGYRMRACVGRIAGGLRFERDTGSTKGSARWRVVPNPGGDGGDGGDESRS